MTQKKKTWYWCSRYTRLRDALDYCKEHGIDLKQFARVEDIVGACCSCGKVKPWIRQHPGHFISRGSGGMSGVYYDERNINIQCPGCNSFQQGNYPGYLEFMLAKYNQETIDQLKVLDKINSYKYKLVGLEVYYHQKYDELVAIFKGNDNVMEETEKT